MGIPNLTAAEREYLKDKGLKVSTYGLFIFTADGKMLASGQEYDAGRVKRMLIDSLRKAGTRPVALPRLDTSDKDKLRKPPEGGLVLYVTWKVLGGYNLPAGSGPGTKLVQHSLGVDRMWVRKDEADALASGTLPASLTKRMLQHLHYTMPGHVREPEVRLDNGRISGSFSDNASDQGSILGFVEVSSGSVTRLEVIAKGWSTRVDDFGFSAGLSVVPKGQLVPVAVLFSLADPQDELAKVLPSRAKSDRYLR